MPPERARCTKLPKRPEAGHVFEQTLVRDPASKQNYPGVPFSTAMIDGHPEKVLFDSAAAINYLSQEFAFKFSVPVQPSPCHAAKLADGSTHSLSEVIHPLRIELAGHSELIRCAVWPLSQYDIILGKQWLADNDAIISMRTNIISLKDGISIKAHWMTQRDFSFPNKK